MGSKENEEGKIFIESLGWRLLGDGDRALEYTLSICPSVKEEQIETTDLSGEFRTS